MTMLDFRLLDKVQGVYRCGQNGCLIYELKANSVCKNIFEYVKCITGNATLHDFSLDFPLADLLEDY